MEQQRCIDMADRKEGLYMLEQIIVCCLAIDIHRWNDDIHV